MEVTPKNWYNLGVDETLSVLKSSHDGLVPEEAARRLTEYGPNELTEGKKISAWLIFLEQFKSVLIIILLVATVLSAIMNEIVDAIVIAIIVLFAAGLGFIQEYRAERSMEALKKMTAPTATVIRGGREVEIPARDLVPGDVVIIKTGDRIPADGRLLEAVNLKVEEASLTGESVPVNKDVKAISGDPSIGDRKNMIFTGTSVAYGRGKAVVTSTGMNTEFGKIARLLQEVKEEDTPLQVNLDKMGKWIAYGALSLCAVLVVLGIARGNDILEMIIWGVSLAVAAVPEALPAVVTVSLSLGVQRMAKKNALIRKLSAVETLGSTDYICSDKTGTLTQDQMTVRRVYAGGQIYEVTGIGYEPRGDFLLDGKKVDIHQNDTLKKLFTAGALCNDTTLVTENGRWDVKGDPTEGSLVVLAAKAGIEQQALNSDFPRIHEVPFSSESKRMTTVHQTPTGKIAYAKGAPEVILNACNRVSVDAKEKAISQSERQMILEQANRMAGEALRVLGMAYKVVDNNLDNQEVEQNMVFLGMVGMIDPPREEVKEAIKKCDQAGIRSVMITGDHKITAMAIARELGLLKNGVAFSGDEVDRMNQQEFEDMVEKIEVYARVSPAHKLRVVEALVKKDHVVAMTGDGANDAPALKKADIGIAMGITGTDVTKEAAKMVLTDDNFASIVAAVEEGRGVFSNIKKYLVYLLSCNLGEILLMATAILLGPLFGLEAGVIPLIAVQILYVNLATDGLPAIALSVDPPEFDIMQKKPRPRKETIFNSSVLGYMLLAGIWTAAVSLGVFVWALHSGKPMEEAQSICFITLILIQFFNAMSCRSIEQSLFKVGFFKNKWLLLAMAWEIALLILIIYVPPLENAFQTYALTPTEWGLAVLLASTIFWMGEIFKFIRRLIDRNKNNRKSTV
jgi:Ca2+-transporting ATPase